MVWKSSTVPGTIKFGDCSSFSLINSVHVEFLLPRGICVLAKYTFGNVFSSAVEVMSEVSLLLNWKHCFPDTAIEEVNRLKVAMKSTEKGNCIIRLCSQAPLLTYRRKQLRVIRSSHGK